MTILFVRKSFSEKSDLPVANALFGSIPATNRWVPHISLVFREMWDTARLSPSLSRIPQIHTGANQGSLQGACGPRRK
jgi:hypothetical protein